MPTTEQITIKCGASVDPSWRVLRSNGFTGPIADEILTDAILRRLNTERGAFWSDPDYGLRVSDYLLEGMTNEAIERIAIDVQLEITKEERVQSCNVTPSTSGTLPFLFLDLLITIVTEENTEMVFTLRINEVTTDVLTPGANT
jgi:hypothetical protein